MKIRKLVYAILIALSAHPQAFAQTAAQQQYIQSGRGSGNSADSSTAGYAPDVDKAPKTQIGGQVGSTSKAADQQTESQFRNDCPPNMSGTVEYKRKIYVRQDGSIFADSWYMANNACQPNRDPAIADLYNNQTNIYNTLTNITNVVNQIKQDISGGGGGSTPVFNVPAGAFYGNTGGGSVRGFCVDTKYNGWPNLVVKDINWDTGISGQDSGFGMIGPWPNWPGRQIAYRQYVGPICPPGMGFTKIAESGPEAPSGE